MCESEHGSSSAHGRRRIRFELGNLMFADCRDRVEDDEFVALVVKLDVGTELSEDELLEESQKKWGKGSSSG